MAIKTFTTGEVLTASDTNTYLANAGLVYIASGTLSSTATNFASVFSSTYRNYRVVISSIQMSNTGYVYFQMLTGTTPNTSAEYAWAFAGYTAGGTAANDNATGQAVGFLGWAQSGANNIPIGALSFDIYAPNAAERTFLTVQATSFSGTLTSRVGLSEHNLTTAYDGIRFLTNNGAVTFGGNVTIYGYRQA